MLHPVGLLRVSQRAVPFSTREAVFLREHTSQLSGIATVAGWNVALTDVAEPTQL